MLGASDPIPLELPDQWLWEIVDEFVYQFQSYAQYRANLSSRSSSDIEIVNQKNEVWNVLCVLNVLHSLVDKSNIKRQLEVNLKEENCYEISFAINSCKLCRILYVS